PLAAAEEAGLDREMLDQALDPQQRALVGGGDRIAQQRRGRAHSTFSSSGDRQQAEKCPGFTSASDGSLARQRSIAKGHRGLKRQPCGSCSGFGTTPSIVASTSCSTWSLGIEPRRPTV